MLDRLISKGAYEILSRMGRGTDAPGRLGLKLNKDFMSGFEQPETTIFVTGTAGKTTISEMLSSALRYCGYKVGSNKRGSNLSSGVASLLVANSTISGRSKADILVVEVDERFVKKVIPYIHPDYFIICNLTRDQLARNGHFDIVFKDIDRCIDDKPHLILNADNPLSSKFAIGKNNEITYFGVGRNKYSGMDYGDKIDVAYCPVCGSKLEYDYFNYGNFGSYTCPNGDFKRNKPDYEATVCDGYIDIDGNRFEMSNDALHDVYNMAAVYTQLKLLGIDENKITEALNHLDIFTKRHEECTLGDKHGTILLSKNETPISYNQSIKYVSRIDGDKTIAIGFTRISGRYDEKDISWFYDVDYEALAHTGIKKIILFGKYGYDLAVRLRLAGVDESRIQIELDYNRVYEVLRACGDDVYCMFYFDMEKLFKKQLKEAGEKVW